MTLIDILFIILIHYVGDFVFQDEQWSIDKSSSVRALIKHTAVYSTVVGVLGLLYTLSSTALIFGAVTFIFHTITDYYTSKIVSSRFEQDWLGSSIPNFGAFSIIGIDQVLHYFQLFITWKLLF